MTAHDNNGWGAFWIYTGVPECQGSIAQGGFEGDIEEHIFGGSQNATHWDGYGSCHQQITQQLPLTLYTGFHVYGLDYGDNGCLTYYMDGTITSQVCPADGVGTRLVNIRLGTSTSGAGFTVTEVDWMRWYHH